MIAHRLRRLNEESREKERQLERERRKECKKKRPKLILEYENGVMEGPTNICVCCGGLFFNRTTLIYDHKNYPSQGTDIINFVKLLSPDGKYRICKNCHKYAADKRDPKPSKLALSMGLKFPLVPQVIKELNDLEERLCSPRIPFITIRPLDWDGQKGIKGSCVNVPSNRDCFQNILPRRFEESQTIQLKLMRKMNYNKPYMYDTVSPAKCLNALKYLEKKPLFIEANIRSDPTFDWQTRINTEGKVEYIISSDDINAREQEKRATIIMNTRNDTTTTETYVENSFIANNTDLINEPTMLINTTDLINCRDIEENAAIAPGEGCIPLSILFDKYGEELAFLKIYAGEKIVRSDLDLGLRYKSEFRRYDRRCARNLTKLFYSYKKLMAKRLVAAISISMTKTKSYERLTKEDVTKKDKIKKMLKNEDADLIFRSIRSTPHFWKWKLMELNAMIRQLGCPTFFITFSPSEVNWYELISVLIRVNSNSDMTLRQCAAMEREKRLEHISNDPITCARYFENRMGLLMAYLQAVNGPFKENRILDFFWRVDFQYRGSPHVHMMVWLADAPLYETRQQMKTNLLMNKLIEAQIQHKADHKLDDFNEEEVIEELENSEDFGQLVDFKYDKNYNECIDFIDKFITAKRTKDNMIKEIIDLPKKTYKNTFVSSTPNRTGLIPLCSNSTNSSLPSLNFTPDPIIECDQDQEPLPKTNQTYMNNPTEKMVTLKFQQHKHMDNCRIRKTINGIDELFCKYNFPWPILERTIILEPLSENDPQYEIAERHDLLIKKKLNALNDDFELEDQFDEEKFNFLSQEQLLIDLGLTFDQYILALRSSITKSTVFLKRNSSETFLNNYNSDIIIRHRANMDIQFITDPYGCATYVSAYLLKSNAVMSGLMQKVSDETRYGDMSHRQRLNKIAAAFHSGQEVGGPEASYGILSMPVAFASRSSTYINTFRSEDRHLILKHAKILKKLPNDSEDIFQSGLLDHYENRPESMEETCLADFAANFEYVSVLQYKKLFQNHLDTFSDEDDDDDQDDYNILHRNDNNQRDVDDENEIVRIADDIIIEELAEGLGDASLDSEVNAMMALIIQQPLNNDSTETSNATTSTESSLSSKNTSNPNRNCSPTRPTKQNKSTKPNNYIKLMNKQGYIRPRKMSKFFRYKKFNKKSEQWDHYRAELMLYLPWRDDKVEFEELPKPDGTFEMWEESIETILFNKAKHQKVNGQAYDKVWESMEDEIEAFYEEKNQDRIDQLNRAQEILMRGRDPNQGNRKLSSIEEEADLDEINDELEQEHGYQANFMPAEMFFEMSSSKQDDDVAINVPTKLNEEAYYQLMSRLNRGQHLFVMNFIKAIRKQPNKKQQLVFIGGGAGKGKSFLISAIYQTYIRYRAKIDLNNIDLRLEKKPKHEPTYAVICAPTGKAAFSVTGVTCHSLVGLKRSGQFCDLTSQEALKRLYTIFKDNPLIICDELNMVGANLLFKIDRRLRQIMKNNKLPFGGCDFLGFGDLFQAEPVLDSAIFDPHTIKSKNIAKDANPYEKIVGSALWAHFRFYELTEIMRQRDDLEFAKCLHTLGEFGLAALNKEQIKMLDSRIMAGGMTDPRIPADALHLFFTNQDVGDYNRMIINNGKDKQTIHHNYAVDVARGKEAHSAIALNFLSTLNQHNLKQGANLPHSIDFKLGCKYMLILNDNIKDGLYNGAIGILRHVILNNRVTSSDKIEKEPIIKRVYIQFVESERIGTRNRDENAKFFRRDGIDPFQFGKKSPLSVIEYHEEKLRFETEKSMPGQFDVWRKQFPIVECEAITINKAEGQTYTKIGVSLTYNTKNSNENNAPDLASNKLYVALSRVTKLEGLYMYGRESILTKRIARMSDSEKKRQVEEKTRSKVNAEMKRLRSERMIKNHFKFLEELSDIPIMLTRNQMRIMFTNICHYTKKKRMAIESDYGFMGCDMILLCETHTYYDFDNEKNTHEIKSEHHLDHFINVFKTGTTSTNASNGQMCFVKADKIDKLKCQRPCQNVLTNAQPDTGNLTIK